MAEGRPRRAGVDYEKPYFEPKTVVLTTERKALIVEFQEKYTGKIGDKKYILDLYKHLRALDKAINNEILSRWIRDHEWICESPKAAKLEEIRKANQKWQEAQAQLDMNNNAPDINPQQNKAKPKPKVTFGKSMVKKIAKEYNEERSLMPINK